MRARIWFHRTCAIVWILLLVPAYLWWSGSILLVIVASFYANVKSDWAASEAADDRAVMSALDDIKAQLAQMEERWTSQNPP